jgi:hypothetical protein
MAEKRFKPLGMECFFVSFLDKRIVPRDHFLVELAQVIYWDSFTAILLPAYKGRAEKVRPPYPPVVIPKGYYDRVQTWRQELLESLLCDTCALGATSALTTCSQLTCERTPV